MTKSSRIGIVDDDAIAVFGLKRALMAIGRSAELLVFENGQDALDAFKTALADKVVLPSFLFIDLNMPVLDGWDFMEEFAKSVLDRADWPEIYIMTSSIDVKDLEKAKVYGLETHYLIKPVSTEDLAEIFH